MKTITVSHISHGILETGGFRHEQFLLNAISENLKKENYQVNNKTIRARKSFIGFDHLKLLWFGFINAVYDINFVVARIALPAMIRNLFTNRKILIVLHYFDERDGKKQSLKWYYHLLFFFLQNSSSKNVSIIVPSVYWVRYFEEKLNKNIPILLFPNFFETNKYLAFNAAKKSNRIHLGQYSWKNDQRIFELANELSVLGFDCYFSTMQKSEVGKFEHYNVVFEDHATYLQSMAESLYTVSFIKVNEGWNRVAHESILVGTTLIGNNAGGLGDLIKESGSLMANTVDDFVELIKSNTHSNCHKEFIEKYDVKNCDSFLKPITDFINS